MADAIYKRSGVAHLGTLLFLLTLSPIALAEHLPVRVYTTADGLWSSAVSYLIRDTRGFIWLCTRHGLSRFDGYRFINYKLPDDAAQSDSAYILQTRKGVFWLAPNAPTLN